MGVPCALCCRLRILPTHIYGVQYQGQQQSSELKPGASVAVSGTVKTGGTVEASRITIGRGGVVPN